LEKGEVWEGLETMRKKKERGGEKTLLLGGDLQSAGKIKLFCLGQGEGVNTRKGRIKHKALVREKVKLECRRNRGKKARRGLRSGRKKSTGKHKTNGGDGTGKAQG